MKRQFAWLMVLCASWSLLGIACLGDDDFDDPDAAQPDAATSSSSGDPGSSSGDPGSSSGAPASSSGDPGSSSGDPGSSSGGSSSGGAEPEPNVEYTVGSFLDAVSAAWCNNYANCCAGDPDLPDSGNAPTCATASRQRGGFLDGVFDSYFYNSHVAQRRNFTLDNDKANACVRSIATLGCINKPAVIEGGVSAVAWSAMLEDCVGVLSGTLELGAQCYSDLECQVGTWCRGARSNEQAAPGVCSAYKAIGDEISQQYDRMDRYFDGACSYRGFHFDRDAVAVGIGINPIICREPLSAGQPCIYHHECASHSCFTDTDTDEMTCSDDVHYDPYFCSAYFLP